MLGVSKADSANGRRALKNGALAAVTAFLVMSTSSIALAQFSDRQAENAYYNSRYGYCDAKKIASVWGVDEYQGKIIIGNKILGGLTRLANQDIASTRNRVWCSWEESDLSYNDAEWLAGIWAVDTYSAKVKVERYISEMGTFKFRRKMGI
jgi:hypothetical protein